MVLSAPHNVLMCPWPQGPALRAQQDPWSHLARCFTGFPPSLRVILWEAPGALMLPQICISGRYRCKAAKAAGTQTKHLTPPARVTSPTGGREWHLGALPAIPDTPKNQAAEQSRLESAPFSPKLPRCAALSSGWHLQGDPGATSTELVQLRLIKSHLRAINLDLFPLRFQRNP